MIGNAVLVQNHDLPLKLAYVYDNTIYAAGTGIKFGSAAPSGDAVIGNLVFAGTDITGSITNKKDNLELGLADAPTMVKAPSKTLGAMDFYPLTGKCTGAALDLASIAGDVARDVDFNGTPRTPPIYRGAYHGSGTNPGWPLGAGPKDLPGTPATDAGPTDGGAPDATTDGAPAIDSSVIADSSPSGDGGTPSDGGTASDAATSDPGPTDDGGCGCAILGRARDEVALGWAFVVLGGVIVRARRRTSRQSE